ncbi:MAG: Fpg/Nei family DNA glycosylase [Thermoanaerobaculia bacterium]
MPELPDLELYRQALASRVLGETLERVRIANPFVLRSVEPPLGAVDGKRVEDLKRLGKRLVLALEGELFLVLHLMIAGRLRWGDRGAAVPRRVGLAAFDLSSGTLVLTEAGSKRRASLHLVAGRTALAAHDPGGIEPLTANLDSFRAALGRERHTLKRALTDPRLIAGIGNAYSDEILHAARLSPFQRTDRLDGKAWRRLHRATQATLAGWRDRLVAEAGDRFPDKVTAFRPEMAVHGRHRQPCPVCGAPVQRIVYAENESNYCPGCQTGGEIYADRALSRLLHDDWPRTLDELERR